METEDLLLSVQEPSTCPKSGLDKSKIYIVVYRSFHVLSIE